MKLRTILKIISFVLLVFSTMIALRYPMSMYVLGGVSGNRVAALIYNVLGSSEVKIAELAFYILFAFHMHILDFKFPGAKFGMYFRYDMVVALVNYVVITMEYENVALGYMAKLAMEMAACVTTMMCGWSLCKVLKNHGMMMIGRSYIVLSSRHIVYLIILVIQFSMIMNGESKNVEQFLTHEWVLAQWLLLMPLLFVSRLMLFQGTMKLKVHKHKREKYDLE